MRNEETDMKNQAQLSDKDKQFRDFSLHDNMWRVVLYVGFPLALYQSPYPAV